MEVTVPERKRDCPRSAEAGAGRIAKGFCGGAGRPAVFAIGIVCAGGIIFAVLGFNHAPSFHVGAASIEDMYKKIARTPAALLFAVGLYTLGGTFFVPVTAMTAAAVVAFGPIKGVTIAYAGSLLSGMAGWGAGRYIGRERLKNKFGNKARTVMDKIKGSNIAGVALIRVVPLAPYSLVNMVFGAAGVSLVSFLAGTVIGLAPGKLAVALTGHGIIKMFENPTPARFFLLALGIAAWIGVIYLSHAVAARRAHRR
jgi:uncharacterized membrane protein YdjX (TVP38/TMEM64 family)